ncbi:MAG: efflux RND transporter periplasmic adaptor subunit [Gammaproteobacteria bacterium]
MALNNKLLIALAAAVAGGMLAGYALGRNGDSAASKSVAVVQDDIAAAQATLYSCPMHPEVVSETPGKCPICGMDLVKHGGHGHGDDSSLFLSPSVVHNLGIRTAPAKIGEMQQNVETIGKITRIDLTARRIVTPPINGSLVYIVDKYEGDDVTKGELLFSVVSPELFELERRFQRAAAENNENVGALQVELSNKGLSEAQLADLKAGAAAELPVNVHAQDDGFIFARRGEIGAAVTPGFTVFNLGGNGRVVEVTAEIFEREWGRVAVDQNARMSVRGVPGVFFEGRVVRVEPPVGYTTRSLEVLLKFKTEHTGLSQSMFAHVTIQGRPRRNVLMVPTAAVIRTGAGERVITLGDDGRYRGVAVVAGEESAGKTEILSGLEEGETVVESGQFLIDSESNLQAALLRTSATETEHRH